MAIQTHGFVPENECTVHYRLQFLFLGNIKCRSRACAPMTDAPTACFHEQCDGTHGQTFTSTNKLLLKTRLLQSARTPSDFRLRSWSWMYSALQFLGNIKCQQSSSSARVAMTDLTPIGGSGGRWEKTRSKRNSTSRQPLIAFRTIYISLICDPTDRGYRNTINIRKWKLLLLFTSTASNELYESFREKRAPLMD